MNEAYEAYKAWQQNINGMIEEIRSLSFKYIALKEDRLREDNQKHEFEKLTNNIDLKLKTLSNMFATNSVPRQVTDCRQNFLKLKKELRSPERMIAYIRSNDSLPEIALPTDEKPSFDSIFESYANDDELNKLVDELINLLSQILEIADEELSAQITRDLTEILGGLKKRRKASLNELYNWLDLGVKVSIKIFETHTGFTGIDLAYEAAKIGSKSIGKLMNCHDEAQKKFLSDRKLKFAKKVVEDIPTTLTECDVVARIEQSKKSSNNTLQTMSTSRRV